jgi:hypothetical protein
LTKINNNRLLAQQMAQQQGLTAAQNPYANSVGIGTKSPMQPMILGTTNGTETMRITANGDLQIGSETLNEGIIKKMKGALGI